MVNRPVKWLSVLLTLLLANFLTSQTAFAHDVYESIENPEAKEFGNRVCMNKDCVKLAAMLIQDRNDKVSPCDDFAAHVCGNFKINNDDSNYANEAMLTLHRKLRRMMKSPPAPNEKPWYNLARSFYEKCLDTDRDVYPDLRVLLDEIGGWPALTAGTNDWTEFDESFEEYIANIHRKYRVDFFFYTIIKNVQINKTTKANVIYVIPSQTELNITHLKDLSIHGSRFNPKPKADSFKTELFNTLTFHRTNKVLYNTTSKSKMFYGPLSKYKKEFPHFDFEKYFKRLYDGVAPFDPETIVAFESADYFRQFHQIFRPKNKRKIANYASFLVLQYLLGLPITLLNKAVPTREVNCFYLMYGNLLVYPVSQMYVEKHMDRETVQKINKMVKLIKEELREALKTASWLDDKTKANALFKIDKMANRVAFPENLFNDTYVEENWNIPPSPPSESFYELAARLERKVIASSLSKLTQPPDTISFRLPILLVNAYYNPGENKFVIQSGIIQLPYFSTQLPDYINYATIGTIIGHEMMHGFDNKGRKFNAFGDKVDWWDNATSTKYTEKANCYVDQYTAEGVDGMLSLGENIADNVGFKLTYNAYKRLLKRRGGSVGPALPSFEKYSLEQMFFIAGGHEWCNNGQRLGDVNDPHPPQDVRLKMIARNSKHFGKAFNCDKTSPMNPEEKCSIW